MANEKNLRPFDTLPESKQREIRRKGGLARQQQIRERKAFSELFSVALPMMSKDGKTPHDVAIVNRLIEKAENGDVKAFLAILEAVGEKSKTKVEVSAKVETVEQLSNDQLLAIAQMSVDDEAN